MTLLQSTMLMLTISCALMLVGFSARESRWGPALMMRVQTRFLLTRYARVLVAPSSNLFAFPVKINHSFMFVLRKNEHEHAAERRKTVDLYRICSIYCPLNARFP